MLPLPIGLDNISQKKSRNQKSVVPVIQRHFEAVMVYQVKLQNAQL